ncbi:Spc7-domain-containing protein [Metschnikowia bicuspidata var. bicuspidata NRRL YB-4993]|uniref:Spc7-domain-containing protein n=1 Tax=Metschnikowia bicuspidata var. bicuspidata NRRL YB-4993 TaxID=869754 RepID=A0A1A0H902_9ASCO|nr:Spc7-domain-containing protein [Metschnikowia bicuspidata var. bicuspidata NRRL YB-4993]OBA20486.1 Spc7-domain-containing protein [Metschnikowia bicuspidata var. bicuspidata NRRL YB-4993]
MAMEQHEPENAGKPPPANSENLASHMTSPPAPFVLSSWPRKSILKHKESENATVPISFGSRTSQPQPERPVDRRVSFAERVQLHKIDTGHNGETRRDHNSDDHANEDESSDIDTSFLALEADADKVLSLLQQNNLSADQDLGHSDNTDVVPDLHGLSNSPTSYLNDANISDEDSENSMELTGPILSKPSPAGVSENAVLDSGSHPQDGLSEAGPSHKPLCVGPGNLLHRDKNMSTHFDGLSHADFPANNAGLETITSQLPEDAPHAFGLQSDFSYSARSLEFSHASAISPGNNLMLSHHESHAPSLTSSEDFLDGEEDMEFTLQVEHLKYEELTMELTLPQTSSVASLVTQSAGLENSLRVFETTMNMIDPNMFSRSSDHNNADEVTMELTTPVQALAKDSPVNDAEELTMELTKPIDRESVAPSEINTGPSPDLDQSVPSDDESAMELTQPVSAPTETADAKAQTNDAELSKFETQISVSPIYVKSQESVGETSVSEPANDDDKNIGAEDLSTINEEDSDLDLLEENSAEMAPATETVQTPTNIETPGEDVMSIPNDSQTGHNKANFDSRSSSLSALSDVNNYDEDSPQEYMAGKHSLGPAMNPSPTKKLKASKTSDDALDPGSIEYKELLQNNWDVPEISLTDFLENIGVKFYDDLELATDFSAMYHASSLGTGSQPRDAYYKAVIQLPIFEMYELTCKELTAQIQEGKRNFDKLKEECQQSNPFLFKHYLSSEPHEQLAMRTNYHVVKEYSRQKAKGLWYEWRKKIIQNVLHVYQNSYEALQEERIALESQIGSMDHQIASIHNQLRALTFDLRRFKEIQADSKGLDRQHVYEMKARMVELNKSLLNHKTLISEKEDSVQALQKEIDDRSIGMKQLRSLLSGAEEELNKMKHYNSKEIKDLQVSTQILQACAGLKFVGHQKHLYEFEIDPRIRIMVDATTLADQPKLLCQVSETGNSSLFNENMIAAFRDVLDRQEIANATNATETFRKIRELWLKIKLVDQEIYRVNLLYPVCFLHDDSHLIDFRFDYLSFDAKTKIEFTVSIPKHNLLLYPEGNTVRARLLRGDGDTDTYIKNALLEVGDKLVIFTQTEI